MLKHLGLAGDGDEIAAIQNVERDFGVSIDTSDALGWKTVGDVYDALLAVLPDYVAKQPSTWGRFCRALSDETAVDPNMVARETTLLAPKGRRNWRLLGILVGVSVATIGGLIAYHDRPATIIVRILRPKQPIMSLQSASCKDWSFTDENVDCRFAISDDEFSKLLSGYAFTRRSASGSSSNLAGAPDLGPPFAVAEEYTATPSNAPHGGSILLWTDRQHRNVRLSYWIE